MTLHPCPYCQAKPEFYPELGDHFVSCPKCYMTGPKQDEDGSKWNELPQPSLLQTQAKQGAKLAHDLLSLRSRDIDEK